MENEKILIKGTPKKNKIAIILIIIGIALAIGSFMFADIRYQNDGSPPSIVVVLVFG